MAPRVGGTPSYISAGASSLQTVENAARDAAGAFDRGAAAAANAVGDEAVAAALGRYRAAWSRYAGDLAAQLGAAAMLAEHSAQDLTVAGGGRVRAQ